MMYEMRECRCHSCGAEFAMEVPVGAFYEVHCPKCVEKRRAKMQHEKIQVDRVSREVIEGKLGNDILGSPLFFARHLTHHRPMIKIMETPRKQPEVAMKRRDAKAPTIGQLVNKLERNIALANMRGDVKSAQAFRRMLEKAVNSTTFPKVST